jgi:hypothetical protein
VTFLVDEFNRLRAERVPEQRAGAAGGLDGDVDLREPAVVVFVGGQQRVGRDGFPQAGEITVIGGEQVADFVVRQAFLGCQYNPSKPVSDLSRPGK